MNKNSTNLYILQNENKTKYTFEDINTFTSHLFFLEKIQWYKSTKNPKNIRLKIGIPLYLSSCYLPRYFSVQNYTFTYNSIQRNILISWFA